ncbi:poly alpha-glucosyltransferase, partial [Acinetobacter oleivorans]|nr:poly alpha-glucosyltransferase [Acinetobacter oleivorans]
VLKRIYSFLDKLYSKNRRIPEFFKIDIACNISEESWSEVDFDVLNQEHNNHYRKGISFDDKFHICFLEQEIYGKAIIKGISFDKPNFFDEKNLNDAIKSKYKNITKVFKLDDIKKVWVFDTVSAFYENEKFIDL